LSVDVAQSRFQVFASVSDKNACSTPFLPRSSSFCQCCLFLCVFTPIFILYRWPLRNGGLRRPLPANCGSRVNRVFIALMFICTYVHLKNYLALCHMKQLRQRG